MTRPMMMLVMLLVAAPGLADDLAPGKQVYDTRCSFCHGVAGQGDGPAGMSLQPPPVNFTQKSYWENSSGERVKQVVINGKQGTAMVPFGTSLTPQEIDAVVAYVETFKPK